MLPFFLEVYKIANKKNIFYKITKCNRKTNFFEESIFYTYNLFTALNHKTLFKEKMHEKICTLGASLLHTLNQLNFHPRNLQKS